jgi:hypothetical protein
MTRSPSCWKKPLLQSLAGFVLGALTSLVVVAVANVGFPQISDAGIDAGMRLAVHLERLGHFSEGLPDDGGIGYVFLDVDPEHAEGSLSGCDALRKHETNDGLAPPEAAPPTQECRSTRPFNRHLLAEIVRELRSRGTRLIVMDIVLSEADASKKENDELVAAMWFARDGDVPVVFAAPVQPRNDDQSDGALYFEVEPQSSLEGSQAATFRNTGQPAVAVPSPEQPVRRYPRCASIEGGTMRTLPFAAADLIRKRPGRDEMPCRAPAHRIVYTIPPFAGHEDSAPGTKGRDTWAFYRKLANRCLVGNFWNAASRCGAPKEKGSAFTGKIVVVGASNPIRRDWHYTPLGNMVGPEVVINTIRSALQVPNSHDPKFWGSLGSKLLIVIFCAVLWFPYHVWRLCRSRRSRSRPSRWATVTNGAIVSGGFVVTLFAVVVVTLLMSLPHLDVLIGVLAISLELYVEGAQVILHYIEQRLASWLGLSRH